MSVLIQTRGEAGGGVAAHLQCPHCGQYSKSHAHQLSHMAELHPSCLDDVAVGRLGNILMYQSTAQLFHCAECFFTSRDFNKLYKHIIAKHCKDGKGGGEGGEEEEEEEEDEEGGKGALKRKRSSEEEENGPKDSLKRREISEEKGGGEQEAQESSTKVDEEQEGGDGVLGVKRSGEEDERESMDKEESVKVKEEEEEDGEKAEGEKQEQENEGPVVVKTEEEDGGAGAADRSALTFDGAGYRCLICGWRNKLKVVGVNHVVRKHDIPRTYASQALRRESPDGAAAAAAPAANQTAEDEEVAGLSGDMLKEEMKATAKVVRYISNRFVCLICGWKTKLKGFALSHVVRCHDVERPYSCKECSHSFFLPSRLQQHISMAHRPGCYACPFCYFRSHFLGGFRRHCSRCNAREEEGEDGGGRARAGGGGGGGGLEEEEEEGEGRKERRGGRQRRKTVRMLEAEEDD